MVATTPYAIVWSRYLRCIPADKSNMAKYAFGGFARCLFATQKFDSKSEGKLALILDRPSEK